MTKIITSIINNKRYQTILHFHTVWISLKSPKHRSDPSSNHFRCRIQDVSAIQDVWWGSPLAHTNSLISGKSGPDKFNATPLKTAFALLSTKSLTRDFPILKASSNSERETTYLNFNLDWKRSAGWLESWEGLLFETDVSTTCAGHLQSHLTQLLPLITRGENSTTYPSKFLAITCNQVSHRYRDALTNWAMKPMRSRVQTPLKFCLFQASVRNCLNCVQNCDGHGLLDFKSEVQYMKHFMYHFTSIPRGHGFKPRWSPDYFRLLFAIARIAFKTAMVMAYLISNPQFNIWNISCITSHPFREVTGSNPVEVLTFSGFCSQLLKLRSKLPINISVAIATAVKARIA